MRKKISLSPTEYCKKHKTDHTGTDWGSCVSLWRSHSKKLKAARRMFALVERWLNVGTLPAQHPLRKLKKTLFNSRL